MARRLKFREPTDVVSVRLPVSLIERLDALCTAMGLGRGDFFAAVLRHYPKMPSPERARIWLANLVWLFIGGSTAALAAWHSGAAFLDDGLAPARRLSRPALQFESGASGSAPPTIPAPMLLPRDVRLEPTWRPGNLQGLIPRLEPRDVAPDTAPDPTAPQSRNEP